MVDQILNFIKNKYFIGTVAAVVIVYAALSFNQYLSEEQNKKDFKKFISVNERLANTELSAESLLSNSDLNFNEVGYEIIVKTVLAKKAIDEGNLTLGATLFEDAYSKTKESNMNLQTKNIVLEQFRENIVRIYMEIDDYENGAKFLEMGNNRDASFYELAGDFYKYFGENELANENYDLAISADTDETQKNLINLKRPR